MAVRSAHKQGIVEDASCIYEIQVVLPDVFSPFSLVPAERADAVQQPLNRVVGFSHWE
jgi:hypothetical protein